MDAQEYNERYAERNAEIARLRLEEGWTLARLAAHYDISRERVRQITKRLGVDGSEAAHIAIEQRRQERVEEAEKNSEVILMRYIAGDEVKDIASDLGLSFRAVKEALDELITDEVQAARSNVRLASVSAPRDSLRRPREDRHWTRERVLYVLADYAIHKGGGMLPTSTEYSRISQGNKDLPSFATVRNRVGRWTAVRAEVHTALKAARS